MALISTGLFPDLEGTGDFAGYEDTLNSLEAHHRSDFKYGDLSFTVSVQPPLTEQTEGE